MPEIHALREGCQKEMMLQATVTHYYLVEQATLRSAESVPDREISRKRGTSELLPDGPPS